MFIRVATRVHWIVLLQPTFCFATTHHQRRFFTTTKLIFFCYNHIFAASVIEICYIVTEICCIEDFCYMDRSDGQTRFNLADRMARVRPAESFGRRAGAEHWPFLYAFAALNFSGNGRLLW